MTKFGIAELKKATEQRVKIDEPEADATSGGEVVEEDATLSVRTTRRKRNFWVGQAKMQGQTMAGVVNELLEKHFGLPD